MLAITSLRSDFSGPVPLDFDFTKLALVAPVLLFAMVAHEYAHGYAAYRFGDPTAQQLGRLTWNPAKHIDPFMTIVLPLMMYFATSGRMIFGGAKPVPVNPRNYTNYRRGDIVVSLAGVTTNLAIALLSVPLIIALAYLGRALPGVAAPIGIFQLMLAIGISVNLTLMMFNLLPIPPLDGSHVFKYLLPPQWSLAYQRIGGAGMLILIGALWFLPGLLQLWLRPALYLQRYLEQFYYPFMLSNPLAP